MTSIRRALLVRLLLGLVAVAALATIATYVETRREIGELFDLQLKQLAYSTRIDDLLRGRAMGPAPPEGRRVAGVSEIVTQIWDRDGVLVYWSQPGAGLPVAVTEGYSEVTQNGRNWRVYTHVAGDHAVQVAHAIDERRELAAQVALRTLLPMALLIPLFGTLIWYAVGHGLRPLETMSNAVAARRADAMSPLSERGLPRELRPLASSLNALLARLDEAIGAQRRFTSEAAHELRTPLAALALQVGEVERVSDPGARATAIADLKLGLARTSRLVEQLLTMARLEPEGLTRNFSQVDLVAIANEAIVARAPVAEARNIDLGCTETADVPVQGDAANLATLLANLLDNALRYTPSGGRIDVAITEEAGAAVLTVADTGPGIPAAARERVFERFHREPSPDDATVGVGSGLGLSIVRRIADAHGATVTLDSGAGGKGLVVRVRFPRA
jgi:two-component system OmpR family sensor kinase